MKASFKAKPAQRPLTDAALHDLALRYVGKYATTRAKLRAYLSRKLRERSWEGDGEPDLEALAEHFAELGYIDDAAYALSQSRSLSSHGYGKRRLAQKLRVAGVEDADSAEANALAEDEAVNAVLRFAKRRRLGPFAASPSDPRQRDKWIDAMIRAGHRFALARAIAAMPPGSAVDEDGLRECAGTVQL